MVFPPFELNFRNKFISLYSRLSSGFARIFLPGLLWNNLSTSLLNIRYIFYSPAIRTDGNPSMRRSENIAGARELSVQAFRGLEHQRFCCVA